MKRKNAGTWAMLLALGAILLCATLAQSAEVSWTPVTTYTDGTPIPAGAAITYQIYLGPTSEGSWTASGSPTAELHGAAPDPAPGGTRWYTVRSIVDGMESANGDVVSKSRPFLQPNPPTRVTVR